MRYQIIIKRFIFIGVCCETVVLYETVVEEKDVVFLQLPNFELPGQPNLSNARPFTKYQLQFTKLPFHRLYFFYDYDFWTLNIIMIMIIDIYSLSHREDARKIRAKYVQNRHAYYADNLYI